MSAPGQPMSAMAAARLQFFLDNDVREAFPYPRHFDDARLNPWRRGYNPDVAWRALTQLALPGMTTWDIVSNHTEHSLRQLYYWRRRYCDPNDPKCDKCAVFLRPGPNGPSADWPPYRAMVYGTCSTGGIGRCTQCNHGECETMGLSSDTPAVREFVRGRQWWWFESVGKINCDRCAHDVNAECDVWTDGGCTACTADGIACSINGHTPGSVSERITRRSGYETRILDIKPEQRDTQRDLSYLWHIAINTAIAPGQPPNHRIPPYRVLPASAIIRPGSTYFASTDQAREALVIAGANFAPISGEIGHFIQTTPTSNCLRCSRFHYQCVRSDPSDPASTCRRCFTNGVVCQPRQSRNFGAWSLNATTGSWDLNERTLNGRYLNYSNPGPNPPPSPLPNSPPHTPPSPTPSAQGLLDTSLLGIPSDGSSTGGGSPGSSSWGPGGSLSPGPQGGSGGSGGNSPSPPPGPQGGSGSSGGNNLPPPPGPQGNSGSPSGNGQHNSPQNSPSNPPTQTPGGSNGQGNTPPQAPPNSPGNQGNVPSPRTPPQVQGNSASSQSTPNSSPPYFTPRTSPQRNPPLSPSHQQPRPGPTTHKEPGIQGALSGRNPWPQAFQAVPQASPPQPSPSNSPPYFTPPTSPPYFTPPTSPQVDADGDIGMDNAS
ncbi:hypothetical protein AB5N19_10480 [Seiridium cardinale]